MPAIPVWARAVLAVVLLVAVVFLFAGYLGQYRSSKGTRPPVKAPEASSTVEPTATAGSNPGATGAKTQPVVPGAVKGATVVVQIEGLNFRKTPTADADVVRGLAKGERLTWLATEGGWFKVADKEGRIGWVSSNSQYATLEK